ncbi:hypothetical protein PAECIP111893_04143 [Paenibacillus plantiphilus]|uniref:GIY-YIG domain-containing protein n=1 Tax=Paenibacillus plantiphilus TaxID=2905650 RepID=A0ABM9CK40_9BACL|nr:GIY-YIG nuclease family protein [Paenibacillus plantiphilus]CAH1216508.1 hypothetical protein PAECIP111893_04143 [Paenibacillus plantiphilus]
MFGTVIRDCYSKDEVALIVKYLDDLCNPNDSIGWSSSGIYCFWDYYTGEVLYIGLAIDLTIRFMQHNGLTALDNNSCKKQQIEEYFQNNEKIGFSIFVQSALEQPKLFQSRERIKDFPLSYQESFSLIGKKSYDNLKKIEGILIQSFRMKHNRLPKWNKIGGSVSGQKAALVGNYEIVDLFSNGNPSLLASKYTLRELSENDTALYFEENMHAMRMKMLLTGIPFKVAKKIYCMTHKDVYSRMKNEGYFSHLV